MFDIGFLELVLVGIVALLVLGPERLPHAARMTGAFLGKMSRMVQSVRDEVEREVNIHEMQQRIKKQVEDGMIGDLRKELSEAQQAIQEGFTASSKSPSSQVTDPDEATDDLALLGEPKPAPAVGQNTPTGAGISNTAPSANPTSATAPVNPIPASMATAASPTAGSTAAPSVHATPAASLAPHKDPS